MKLLDKKKAFPQVRINTDLFEAIMTRRFTLIQRRILDLVIRFQYGFNVLKKSECNQSNFLILGISDSAISVNLKILVVKKVLIITDKVFSINSNIEEWEVEINKKFNNLEYKVLVTRHIELQKMKQISNKNGLNNSKEGNPLISLNNESK